MANPTSRGQQRDKPFRDALRIEAFSGEDDTFVPKRSLRALARALLDKGATGDALAIREVADRLDGKVPQAVVGDTDYAPVQLEKIERVIIDAANPDGKGVPAVTGPSEV